MTDSEETIAAVRNSVCAVMRVIRKGIKPQGKNKPPDVTFEVAFVGTAWCVADDQYLVTAHHILNGGKRRNPRDKFYVFTVPGNGDAAFDFPIVDFPVEDEANDLAILEIGSPRVAGQHIPAVPVSLDRPTDGSAVVTYGFPSPTIADGNMDAAGRWQGGTFFLKGHANEGIVAAQYALGGVWQYEFNVGWHHGESGGPVFQNDSPAAIAVMQFYRNIESPHGVVAGPHCGRALAVMSSELTNAGATFV